MKSEIYAMHFSFKCLPECKCVCMYGPAKQSAALPRVLELKSIYCLSCLGMQDVWRSITHSTQGLLK